jgi:ferredoxin
LHTRCRRARHDAGRPRPGRVHGPCGPGADVFTYPEMGAPFFTVHVASCIRCACCSILSPQVFEVSRRGSRVIRQPDGAAEVAASLAAALACPTSAIAADAGPR